MSAPGDADLRQRVVDSICVMLPRILKCELPAMSEDTKLLDDVDLSSGGTLELLLELEDELEIQIDVEDFDVDAVESVGTLADYVAGHALTA